MDILDTSLPGDIQTPLDPNKEVLSLDDIPDLDSQKYIDEIPDLESPLFQNFKDVSQENPDLIAKIDRYSKKLDENPKFIQTNINEFEKVMNSPSSSYWDDYEKRFPQSAKFLKDRKNMAMAHDDHEQIAKIEETSTQMGMVATLYSDFANIGLSKLYSSSLRIPSAIYNIAALPQNIIADTFDMPSLRASSDNVAKYNPLEMAAGYYDKQAKNAQDQTPFNQDIISLAGDGKISEASYSLTRSLIQNSPQQILNIVLASSGVGAATSMAVTGLGQSGSAFSESKDSGATTTARTIDAISQGASEALFENLGTMSVVRQMESALEKSVGKQTTKEILKQTAQKLAAAFIQEGTEEGVTTLAQEGSKVATGVDKNALDGVGGKMANSFLIGGFSGATMTSPIATGMAYQKMTTQRKAEVMSNFFDKMIERSSSSKLKERNPEAHEALINSTTTGTPVENGYIDAGTLNTFFQKNNMNSVDALEELGIKDQFEEAIETGSNVKIPMAKILTKLNPEQAKALKEDIKFGENDLSVNEVKNLNTSIEENIKAVDDHVQTLIDSDQNLLNAKNEIQSNLYQQMINTGMKESEAKANAELTSSLFISQAANEGIDPMELYNNQMKLKIVSGDQQVPFNYERKTIPKFESENIASSDAVSRAIDELELPEQYKSEEAISAIRSQLSYMMNQIEGSEAGKRIFLKQENTMDLAVKGQKSTFPEWSKNLIPGGAKKDQLLSIMKSGNSKHFKDFVNLAIHGLRNGMGESGFNSMAPNLDFVSLVDPSYLEVAFGINKDFEAAYGQGAQLIEDSGFELFQDGKGIREKLDLVAKNKNITLTNNEDAPIAEFDKLTGELTINQSKIKNTKQLEEIMTQFDQSKREFVKGTFNDNFNGESLEIDTAKAISSLTRKLYGLQRLAECVRG